MNKVLWGIGGALGTALLILASNLVVAGYQGQLEIERDEREQAAATVSSQREALTRRLNEYEAFGTTLTNASDFAETGEEKYRTDFDRVARHFRGLVSDIANNRIDGVAAATSYGGRLPYWASRFTNAGSLENSDDVSASTYVLLGRDLTDLAESIELLWEGFGQSLSPESPINLEGDLFPLDEAAASEAAAEDPDTAEDAIE